MGKIIAANWKMNNDFADIKPYVQGLKKYAKKMDNLVVCVPSVFLKTFADRTKKLCYTGAEDCYFEDKGAFTGEISAKMVKNTGATWCIVGHSERRNILNESNIIINKKLQSILKNGLKAIFCIGEKLEERTKYKSVLKKQIIEGFVNINDFSNVVIAYEPVWAIGTGKVATNKDIEKVHQFIKEFIKEKYNVDIKVLYGGSVKPNNSKEILALNDVDGVLIGGASLNINDYIAIARSR